MPIIIVILHNKFRVGRVTPIHFFPLRITGHLTLPPIIHDNACACIQFMFYKTMQSTLV